MYLVDPYDNYIDNPGRRDRCKVKKSFLDKIYKIAKKRLGKYSEISWVRKYSNEAVNSVPIVDYIYIDGNHTYKNVLEDLENYYQKVKSGGILAGHDISMIEVLNAVQDFTRKKGINFQVAGQDWWIVK